MEKMTICTADTIREVRTLARYIFNARHGLKHRVYDFTSFPIAQGEREIQELLSALRYAISAHPSWDVSR